jgi:hypothetical protein
LQLAAVGAPRLQLVDFDVVQRRSRFAEHRFARYL